MRQGSAGCSSWPRPASSRRHGWTSTSPGARDAGSCGGGGRAWRGRRRWPSSPCSSRLWPCPVPAVRSRAGESPGGARPGNRSATVQPGEALRHVRLAAARRVARRRNALAEERVPDRRACGLMGADGLHGRRLQPDQRAGAPAARPAPAPPARLLRLRRRRGVPGDQRGASAGGRAHRVLDGAPRLPRLAVRGPRLGGPGAAQERRDPDSDQDRQRGPLRRGRRPGQVPGTACRHAKRLAAGGMSTLWRTRVCCGPASTG